MLFRTIAAGALALLSLSVLSGPAAAAERVPFSPAALNAAQSAGKPVLVEVTAPWCSVCSAQKTVLSKLLADPKYTDLSVMEVDFDSQKEALAGLKVSMQSTLIVYGKGKELNRSTGETDPGVIKSAIDKAF